ncbi:ceramide glucosyltransferase [Pseudoroseicyclus sp. H15]
MLGELLFGTLAAAPLGAHLASAALASARPLLRRDRPAPIRPFLSLIRPVKGLDPHDRETLESSFRQDYPEYEILFCVEDEDDPAIPALRQMIDDHPGQKARVLIGGSRLSANPKLNNMEKGLAAATSDWLVFTDANLMLAPDYLSGLVDSWKPGTGLVSGPPLGTEAENFWGAVECAFLNTSQARWQLAGDALGAGFAQGKTLFYRRDVLEAGGGLAALGRDLAEDVGSTKLVRGQGLRVRLPRRLSAQPVGHRTAGAVWDRQLRWSIIRRQGFPAIFALELLQGPAVGLLSMLALALMGAMPAALPLAYLALWYGAEALFARAIRLPLGPRDLAAMLTRDFLFPAIWAASLVRRGFVWRGHSASTPQAG